jgi:outer membrane lipoprotein-sorting protein
MTKYTITLLCTLLLLSACGQSSDQPPPKLFEDQRAALDKAKAVEAELQAQAEKQRKAIEQAQ